MFWHYHIIIDPATSVCNGVVIGSQGDQREDGGDQDGVAAKEDPAEEGIEDRIGVDYKLKAYKDAGHYSPDGERQGSAAEETMLPPMVASQAKQIT